MTGRGGERLRVLVTGAAGAVGRPVCDALARRGHVVHGFDRVDRPDGWSGEAWRRGDITDGVAVREAVAGMDTVIHFAAEPHSNARFLEQLVQPNVVGLFQVMDAVREAKVGRVVLASTIQVVSGIWKKMDERDWPLRAADGAAPTNHYALTKLWAEQMGEMYARVHGLSVIAVRIGWLTRNVDEAVRLAKKAATRDMFLSWDDAGRFFACAVEAEGVDYAVLFALSKPEASPRMDREAAKQVIGFEPRDRFPEGLPFTVPGEAGSQAER